jgi:hypothetical protein
MVRGQPIADAGIHLRPAMRFIHKKGGGNLENRWQGDGARPETCPTFLDPIRMSGMFLLAQAAGTTWAEESGKSALSAS